MCSSTLSSNGSSIYEIEPKHALCKSDTGLIYKREKRHGPDLQLVLHNMQTSPKRRQLQHHTPFLVYHTPFLVPEGQQWREILLVGRTSSSAPDCSLGLKAKMARLAIIYQLVGCDQKFSWMVRELEVTKLENWLQYSPRKTAENMNIFLPYVNVH